MLGRQILGKQAWGVGDFRAIQYLEPVRLRLWLLSCFPSSSKGRFIIFQNHAVQAAQAVRRLLMVMFVGSILPRTPWLKRPRIKQGQGLDGLTLRHGRTEQHWCQRNVTPWSPTTKAHTASAHFLLWRQDMMAPFNVIASASRQPRTACATCATCTTCATCSLLRERQPSPSVCACSAEHFRS